MKNLWNKFVEWYCHMYYEGIIGRKCDACLIKEMKPQIDEAFKRLDDIHNGRKRYGCPQDYKDSQDFINSL